MQSAWNRLLEHWKNWKSTKDPDELARGPWDHWRRSFVLLALAFLLFAFTPWIFQAPPLPEDPDPEKIWTSGRIGEPVVWGSSLSFYPGSTRVPSAPKEIFQFRGQSPLLSPLREQTTYPRPALPNGELARFGDQIFTKKEIASLARAEKNLGRSKKPDRGLLYLLLQREIEGAWLQEEARLQGIDLRTEQIDRLLREYPSQVRRLRAAGLATDSIRERARILLLAAAIRSRLPREISLAAFEAEWIQRWKPRTRCRVDLPICQERSEGP